MSESVVQFNRVFAEVNRSQCRYRLLCGGAGGPLNGDPVPITECGFTAEVGTATAYGKGGDSHFGPGGGNGRTGYGTEATPHEERHWNAADGDIGAGGGSIEKYGNWIKNSGAGGDGVVIIYGIPV